MGERPGKAFSVDRIDTNGDYSPENCRWATALEQVNNQRCSLRYVYQGKEHTMAELSEEAKKFGVTYSMLRTRIAKGIAVTKAVETPSMRGKPVSDGRDRVLREGVVKYYRVGC